MYGEDFVLTQIWQGWGMAIVSMGKTPTNIMARNCHKRLVQYSSHIIYIAATEADDCGHYSYFTLHCIPIEDLLDLVEVWHVQLLLFHTSSSACCFPNYSTQPKVIYQEEEEDSDEEKGWELIPCIIQDLVFPELTLHTLFTTTHHSHGISTNITCKLKGK